MDVVLHGVAEGVVDHAMSSKTCVPREGPRNNRHPKVPASGGGAGMAAVQMTLVKDLEVLGLEVLAQGRLDPGRTLARWDHARPSKS